MASIDKIPKYEGPKKILTPNVPRFKSLSVVANSGKLKNSNLGDKIDQSAGVVRMNAAPVEGYEKDVGEKTTFRFINGLLQKGKTLDYIDTPRKWLETLENESLIFMPLGERSRNKAKNMLDNSNDVYIFKKEFKNYINKTVKNKLGKVPSTGILSTLFAKHVSKEVHLYGFGFHQEELENRHYWEDWDDSHNSSHNWDVEKDFLKKLEKKNKNITIHKF